MKKGQVRGSKSGPKKRAAAARKVDRRNGKAKGSRRPASPKKSASKTKPKTVVRHRELAQLRRKSGSANFSSSRRPDEIAEIRGRLKNLIHGAAQKIADATESEDAEPDLDDLGPRNE